MINRAGQIVDEFTLLKQMIEDTIMIDNEEPNFIFQGIGTPIKSFDFKQKTLENLNLGIQYIKSVLTVFPNLYNISVTGVLYNGNFIYTLNFVYFNNEISTTITI